VWINRFACHHAVHDLQQAYVLFAQNQQGLNSGGLRFRYQLFAAHFLAHGSISHPHSSKKAHRPSGVYFSRVVDALLYDLIFPR